MASENMSELSQKLLVALVIVPILLGIFKGAKEMTISVGAIAGALFFANLDKFARFKGAGFEAELRTVVKEAYAAIGELRELGVVVASPVVDELAVSGQMFSYVPLKHKLKRARDIEHTLQKLGVSAEEIKEVCSTLYDRVTREHVGRLIAALRASNPTHTTVLEQIKEDEYDHVTSQALRKLITDDQLTLDEESDEWLRDLEQFENGRTLRRPERWQG